MRKSDAKTRKYGQGHQKSKQIQFIRLLYIKPLYSLLEHCQIIYLFYALYANMQLKDVFVRNLKKIRKNKGITQASLAELCETSTSYIGQIEIGNRFPSLEMIEKIAKALNIRPYILFFNESDECPAEETIINKTEELSEFAKDELIKRLSEAIRRVVRKKTDIQ